MIFKNLDPFEPRGPLDILRWKLGGKGPKKAPFRTPTVENDGRPIASLPASLTWIGHATFVLKLGGLVVATDPIWSPSIGPFVRRLAPPGVALASVPPLDVVTISHAHRDHLDLPTLRAIASHGRARAGRAPKLLVPTGVGQYLGADLGEVIELGWWESYSVGATTFTLVPQQHWSMRTPFDRDRALWGGWAIRGPEGAAYHAGDTAYFTRFAEIGERVGPIDWAMLPIGAYDPRWFMKPQHLNPDEAGQAFIDLGARNLVAMHWGTFVLTDEPIGEPPERLRSFWRRTIGEDFTRLWIPAIGETRELD